MYGLPMSDLFQVIFAVGQKGEPMDDLISRQVALVMSDRDCPCNGCGLRQVNCHGECTAYKDWQTAMAEKKKALKRKMEAEREAAGYIKAAQHREAKRRRR